MAFSRANFTVVPNGQTLVVQVTVGGTALAFYTDAALTSQVTAPITITSQTTYYVAEDGYGPYVISCKQPDGTELYGKGATKQQLVNGLTVEPLPSRAQVAADLNSRTMVGAPSGAFAETVPRGSTGLSNASVLTASGTMFMASIFLQAGVTVTNITFVSGATAASVPLNQWFALYDSSRVLLRQTVDDTTTAWAANAPKTLALTSTFTTTYTGQHYLGINVTATTQPTLFACVNTQYVMKILPKLIGYDGTNTGLTTTAPATAAALTDSVNSIPYAYVS